MEAAGIEPATAWKTPTMTGLSRSDRNTPSDSEKIAKQVRKQVRLAGIHERRPGGHGTLLTEPILVFRGEPRADFEIFDQDGNPVGSAVRTRGSESLEGNAGPDRGLRGEAERLYGPWRCELRNPGGECVVAVTSAGAQGNTYGVSAPDGTKMANLGERRWRFSHTSRPITATATVLGYLKLPCFPASFLWNDRGRVEDGEGRGIARITSGSGGGQHVVEIDDPVVEPLRSVAIAAVIVRDDTIPESGGG
jgi:hypothetical protein